MSVSGGSESVRITEPGEISLSTPFKMSDTVAVVRILSGDTENNKTAIYKVIVVKSFKRSTDGQTLYFGPYIGERLGYEPFVFLRKAKDPAVPTTVPAAVYGTVHRLEV
jgi:electron transfer flavoprotein alpha/beta subunit